MENLPATGTTPSVTSPATSSQTPGNGTVGTSTPSGEATGTGAPGGDTFFSGDPNTLPPQLRSHYENMLRDYKTKTTGIADEVKKQVEQFKQRAEQYDQFSNQEEFVKQWNDYVDKAMQAKANPPQSKSPQDDELRKDILELKSKVAKTEMAEMLQAFEEAVDDKGQSVNPDFSEIVGVVLPKGNTLLGVCYHMAEGKTPEEKLKNGYVEAKKIYDSIVEVGRQSALGKVKKKLNNGSETPGATGGKGVFTGDPKNLSPRQARELAEKGVVVK